MAIKYSFSIFKFFLRTHPKKFSVSRVASFISFIELAQMIKDKSIILLINISKLIKMNSIDVAKFRPAIKQILSLAKKIGKNLDKNQLLNLESLLKFN